MEKWQLQQMQGLPLEIKIQKSKLRIKEWYEHWDGEVYISFSGGKDSTVLLDLVRSIYPDVIAVFVDTGLEYPEIREFVKSIDNVTWLKPEMHFKDVIEKYGYPVISKEVADCIQGARKGQQYRIDRLDGTLKNKEGNLSKFNQPKWKFLLGSPFKISHYCCNVMKKKPFKIYEKKTNNKPIIGTMASESALRQQKYLQNGCNAFESKRPVSNPISFWLEQDIWDYLRNFNISYSKIYDMGYKRTGCMFCMFGVHLEEGENRFQRMKRTHTKQYEYCINNLGLGKVLDFINVKY